MLLASCLQRRKQQSSGDLFALGIHETSNKQINNTTSLFAFFFYVLFYFVC